MAFAQFTVDDSELARLRDALRTVELLTDEAREGVAALLESQTRQRIEDGGPAPDGQPWAEWSDSYARTRHGNHSLLRSSNALLDSIAGRVVAGSAQVAGEVVHAATHQYGRPADPSNGPFLGAEIPARPYLGTSKDDEQELIELLAGFAGATLDAIVETASGGNGSRGGGNNRTGGGSSGGSVADGGTRRGKARRSTGGPGASFLQALKARIKARVRHALYLDAKQRTKDKVR